MKLKEKCVYYNPIQEGYYLVLAIDDKMTYGRRGDYVKTSNLEDWINQDGPGISFKLDDIIINSDYIRNYYLDEKCLEQFELVRELSDEEFYPIEILINSRYNFPETLIDMNKPKEELTNTIVEGIKKRELEVEKLTLEIRNLTHGLYDLLR